MLLKRLEYALKQNAQFLIPSLPLMEPPHIHPILRPPPRPYLRPPPPLPPFILPPRKNYKKFSFPEMLMEPPPRPPFHLMVPRVKLMYTEINKQIFHRPKNLMIELTLAFCKNRLVHFPLLIPSSREKIARKPSLRVHGLRLCLLDDNGGLCYLNHQNQRYLDRVSRIEESEAARAYILNDLRENHYPATCIDELATIWYDDSERAPIDFWIFQFLKHGYFALDDPMLDYASTVGNTSLPLLLPTSSLPLFLPDYDYADDLGPDFGSFDDDDLGTYLLREGFRTNEYHVAEDLRCTIRKFCMSSPRLTYVNQEGHTCVYDISLLRTYPDGFSVDHPLSISLPGYFLMRMI